MSPSLADHVAEVDPDPEADALVLGRGRPPARRRRLDREGALDGVDDAAELAERAVASQLDDPAAVLGQERLDQLLAESLEAPERAGLVALHQPRVADHVRDEDSGEPAVGAGSGQGAVREPWERQH